MPALLSPVQVRGVLRSSRGGPCPAPGSGPRAVPTHHWSMLTFLSGPGRASPREVAPGRVTGQVSAGGSDGQMQTWATWVCLPAWSRASCDRSEPRRPVRLAGHWRTKCPVQRLAQRRCSIKKTTMKKNRNQPGQKKSEGETAGRAWTRVREKECGGEGGSRAAVCRSLAPAFKYRERRKCLSGVPHPQPSLRGAAARARGFPPSPAPPSPPLPLGAATPPSLWHSACKGANECSPSPSHPQGAPCLPRVSFVV